MIRTINVIIAILFLGTAAHADFFVLKSGQMYNGKVIEETDEYIRIDIGNRQIRKVKKTDLSGADEPVTEEGELVPTLVIPRTQLKEMVDRVPPHGKLIVGVILDLGTEGLVNVGFPWHFGGTAVMDKDLESYVAALQTEFEGIAVVWTEDKKQFTEGGKTRYDAKIRVRSLLTPLKNDPALAPIDWGKKVETPGLGAPSPQQ